MKRALLFDCDGVLADTERDGHLVAFNQMWRAMGVAWQWSLAQYAEKLKIGGGKERMASLARDDDFRAVYAVPESESEWQGIVHAWHKCKSALYQELIASGRIPARPGVRRLAEEALDAGWAAAVCSTSALESVESVLSHVMGADTASRFTGVYAGEMVRAKKPAPDIYTLAADRLAVAPRACVVVEDSRNGLLAARAAGMSCVVTVNDLTKGEDFTEAALVVTCLGDPGGPAACVLANRSRAAPRDYVRLTDLDQILAGAAA